MGGGSMGQRGSLVEWEGWRLEGGEGGGIFPIFFHPLRNGPMDNVLGAKHLKVRVESFLEQRRVARVSLRWFMHRSQSTPSMHQQTGRRTRRERDHRQSAPLTPPHPRTNADIGLAR